MTIMRPDRGDGRRPDVPPARRADRGPMTTSAPSPPAWPCSGASCSWRRSTRCPSSASSPRPGVTYAEKIDRDDRRLDPQRAGRGAGAARARAHAARGRVRRAATDGERLGVRRAVLSQNGADVAPGSARAGRRAAAVRHGRRARWSSSRCSPPAGARWTRRTWLRGTRVASAALAAARVTIRACPLAADQTPRTGPQCPSCGEPGLRGTNLPGPLPLRVLPAPLRAALGVPELRRALHDRPDVRHRRRGRAATAARSMLQAI